MPRNRHDKVLLGAAGAVGASVLAWRTLFPWIAYDIQYLRNGIPAILHIRRNALKGRFLVDMFEDNVQKSPTKPFIIFEDRVYTYDFVDQQANRVASIALQWNLKVGETAAIMITNEPAFIWTFLGLQKLGIAVAFINYNIRGQPLVHTIRACAAQVLILGHENEILESVEEVYSELQNIPVYVQGSLRLPERRFLPWDILMQQALPSGVCRTARADVTLMTPSCYIFTSGTTGLPKPCVINQGKTISSSAFIILVGCREDDVIYTTTPLYHSAAGLIGLMGTIGTGATMVLRRKFSARHFWEDCRKHNVTIIQYIGELCRYLLNVPESPEDGKHRVRVAVGNGLRMDIWKKFQTRFRVPNICEFFGATEGPTATINVSNRMGSCGRMSPLLNLLDPIKKHIVKYDPVMEEPIRDKAGHCVLSKVGETGLMLTSFPPEVLESGFYKGSKDVNEQKIIRNVFVDGDAFFSFGDLVHLDKDYFVYFKDRLGDTFRWKGENVSTIEVSNVMTGLDFVHDAAVYGVEVPGTEGRAGMAAVHLKEGTKLSENILKNIYDHCEKFLPTYARPMFLRFPDNMMITVTFKQRKVELVKDGYDPNVVKDPLFYRNDTEKTFTSLTLETFTQYKSKSKL